MSLVRVDAFPELLSNISDSIGKSARWKDVCDRLRQVFAAEAAIVTIYQKPDSPLFTATDSHADNLLETYWKSDRAEDLWLERAKSLPENSILRGSDLLTDSELMESSYYKNFLQPSGLHFLLTGTLINNDENWAYVGLLRSSRMEDYSDSDIRGLSEILPFLQIAVRSYLELRKQRILTSLIADGWMAANNLGIFILNDNREVVFQNTYADDFIKKQSQLALKNNRLAVTGRHVTFDKLTKMLNAALPHTAHQPSGSQFLSARISDTRYHFLCLSLNQISRLMQYEIARSDYVLLIVQEVDKRGRILDETRLAEDWKLTRAEIRVSRCILNGMRTAEIAAENGVKLNTVRAQIRSIYEKLQVNTRTALIRRLNDEFSIDMPQFPDLNIDSSKFSYEIV